MKTTNKKFYIFSHNVEPDGISGGETILIETFKRIGRNFSQIYIYTWKPGKELYLTYGLKDVTYKVSKIPILSNFYLSFFIRTLYGAWVGISLILPDPINSYLYFSSDFLPDALSVIFLKIRYPRAKFISNFYLSAPNPLFGFNEGKKKLQVPSIRGIFFYSLQKPIYLFSKFFADMIFVTSEPDVKRFPRLEKSEKYFVVKGGVNITDIEKHKRLHRKIMKEYDGVFIGRFHPQKGVIELIDIWKKVVEKRKNAKLVMIGDGNLMNAVKEKIRKENLEQNIKLTGYIFDKDKRYDIFQKSRIALHPAVYDSGGMAVAEAMTFGLPAISFDLDALRTYYPKGMIKIPLNDKKKFAEEIIKFLSNKSWYRKIQKEAMQMIYKEWNWNTRADQIGRKINTL